MPNSSYPLIASATPSTDIPYPLMVSTQTTTLINPISSVDDLVAVQSLLGLRERSESERLGCSQAKGEEKSENQHAISSGMAKESERSATLQGEGEGVRSVS